jgi:hypothetical protein
LLYIGALGNRISIFVSAMEWDQLTPEQQEICLFFGLDEYKFQSIIENDGQDYIIPSTFKKEDFETMFKHFKKQKFINEARDIEIIPGENEFLGFNDLYSQIGKYISNMSMEYTEDSEVSFKIYTKDQNTLMRSYIFIIADPEAVQIPILDTFHISIEKKWHTYTPQQKKIFNFFGVDEDVTDHWVSLDNYTYKDFDLLFRQIKNKINRILSEAEETEAFADEDKFLGLVRNTKTGEIIFDFAEFGSLKLGCEKNKKKLNHADISGADLQGANLKGANLKGANLEGANLQGANFQYANFQGDRKSVV